MKYQSIINPKKNIKLEYQEVQPASYLDATEIIKYSILLFIIFRI